MCQSLTKVQWHKVHHAITAFITVILMLLTYSIGYALIGGLGIWIIMQGVFILMKLVFKIQKPTFYDDNFGPDITSAADNVEDIEEKIREEDTSSDGVVNMDIGESK